MSLQNKVGIAFILGRKTHSDHLMIPTLFMSAVLTFYRLMEPSSVEILSHTEDETL